MDSEASSSGFPSKLSEAPAPPALTRPESYLSHDKFEVIYLDMSHQLQEGSLGIAHQVLAKRFKPLLQHLLDFHRFLGVLGGRASTQVCDQQPLWRLFYFFHYNNKMKVYLNFKPQFNIELLSQAPIQNQDPKGL